ncbi:hypothetical protein [Candidatus Nitrosocosmicus sp. SS]|jgi:hypothetical protein|uniref:hypothetical protein n=2 Tax=Candidatus Nitrosocosmicus agrestis TaxID=2563600 RepID=UPI00122DE80A|nr:hypothetical protein [Candidatus Nitrosocosmicus sp. SS]KAF0869776.1 hypothetical protein E5N71_03225 [Candidatus Nitrosocosmicus sp. SS]MDR4490375.1 hypothetical protein [Candidatus Nitrosocosmicus sp.]
MHCKISSSREVRDLLYQLIVGSKTMDAINIPYSPISLIRDIIVRLSIRSKVKDIARTDHFKRKISDLKIDEIHLRIVFVSQRIMAS